MSVPPSNLSPIAAEELAKRSKAALTYALQRAGYNPQFSYLGRQLLNRSERLTPLAMAALGNDQNAVDQFGSFSDAYTNAMLKGGTGGGPWDLSRTGQRNTINSALAAATPGTSMYGFLTEGDPEEQFNKWRGFEEAAQSGRFAPLVQADLNTKQFEFTNFLGNQLSGQGNPNQNWLDVALGRPGPGPGATTAAATPPGATTGAAGPSATTPGAAATTPGATPTAATPTGYGVSASGPQGSLTPPLRGPQYGTAPAGDPNQVMGPNGAPNMTTPLPAGATGYANVGTGQPGVEPGSPTPSATPYAPLAPRPASTPGYQQEGQYTYPENPNRLPPGQTGAPGATTFQQLMQQYGGDRRNWSTRMMGNPSQGFTIGGVTYNPQAEAAQGSQRYRNMSGQGRETARGSNFGVFMYRLAQLTDQRNRGGNAALGITQQTTDDQLARMAAQFVGKNYVGQSAFTGA